jgi:hypothetical protein
LSQQSLSLHEQPLRVGEAAAGAGRPAEKSQSVPATAQIPCGTQNLDCFARSLGRL